MPGPIGAAAALLSLGSELSSSEGPHALPEPPPRRIETQSCEGSRAIDSHGARRPSSFSNARMRMSLRRTNTPVGMLEI